MLAYEFVPEGWPSWPMAPVLKTGSPQKGLGGSNPSPSAFFQTLRRFLVTRIGILATGTRRLLSDLSAQPCQCASVAE